MCIASAVTLHRSPTCTDGRCTMVMHYERNCAAVPREQIRDAIGNERHLLGFDAAVDDHGMRC